MFLLSVSLQLIEMLVKKLIQVSLTTLLGLVLCLRDSLLLDLVSQQELDEQISRKDCNCPIQR